MPQGQIIGRVSVKVLPDTDTFRRDLREELRKINADFHVNLEVDTAKLKAQLKKVKDDLEDWRDRIDPLKIGVKLDMVAGTTTVVAARLEWLTRPRTVPIVPKLEGGAVAGVATALAALSGGRVLKDMLDNLWDIGKNFDRLVPKIGAVALAVGGIAAWSIAGISNISALTLALSQMATASLALPALFAGAAIGAGVFLVALSQMKSQVPGLVDSLSGLKESIGKNFWAEAGTGIQTFVNTYIPYLNTVATSAGQFFGAIAAQLTGPLAAALPKMFGDLNQAIGISTSNAGVFASIITSLGLAGSEYLPRLATWIGDISTKFDNFLKRSAADGSLNDFIESGIQGFKDLGTIILNAAKVIGDIGKAAQAGGGSTLGMMADTMERIHAVTSSPEFQTTLAGVFQTAHTVMSQIATQVGPPLMKLFEALAGTFSEIGPSLAIGLGTAIGAIAEALANPALQKGLQSVFLGLAQAINVLAPAMMPVSNALAALAPLINALLAAIAPLITAALVPLGQIIQILAPALAPLVNLLGGALLQVIVALGPALVQVAQAFANLLVAVMPVVTVILNLLVPVLNFVIEVLASMLTSLINGFTNVFKGITKIFQGFVTMFSGGWANFWNGIKQVLSGVWELIKGVIEIALNIGVLGIFKKGFAVLKTLWSGSWESIKAVAVMLWDSIKSRFGEFLSALKNAPGAALGAIKNLFKGVWDDIKSALSLAFEFMVDAVKAYMRTWVSVVTSIPGKARDALSGIGSTLFNAGKSLIEGFVRGIVSVIGRIKDTLGSITSKLKDWKGPEETDKKLLYEAGQLVIGGFIAGLESQYDAVRRSLSGLSDDVARFTVAAPGVGNISSLVDGAIATGGGESKQLNYYAAPGSSINSEEDLFTALGRARGFGF